jgi:hypothetical protein
MNVKQFIKDAEAKGFDIPEKSIKTNADGSQFECKVDLTRYLNHKGLSDAYPRVVERYKEGKIKIAIECFDTDQPSTWNMDVRIEDELDEKREEKPEDVVDIINATAEGGNIIENIAKLGEQILQDARETAGGL